MAKTKTTLQSLLANDRFQSDLYLCKSAQIQADDTQFETDFTNMAFGFLQDRAPALMRYVLGFETVQRNDDGTRAVGIFGFKVGDDYYYVPAFFMNSQVKGIDSILNKRTNSFVPLTEEWVNFIVNRKVVELGNGVDDKAGRVSEDFENPNFDFLRRPTIGPLGGPKYYKVASFDGRDPKDVPDDGKGWSLRQAWNMMKAKTAEMFEKDKEFRKAVAGSFCAMRHEPLPFDKSAEADGALSSYLAKFGGPRSEAALLRSMRKNFKLAEAALRLYPSFEAMRPKAYDKDCYAVKKAQEAAMISLVQVTFTDKPKDGDEEGARNVIEDGFTVVDNRDESKKSVVYDTDYEKRFQNPDHPGVYNVVTSDGTAKKAYVLNEDRCLGLKDHGATIVFFPHDKSCRFTDNRDVLVDGDCVGSSLDVYEDAKELGQMKPGSKYVFVGPDGSALGVFRAGGVKNEFGTRRRIFGSFDTYCSDYSARSRATDDDDFGNYFKGDRYHDMNGAPRSETWTCVDAIEIADFKGRPTLIGTVVQIPKNWKAIRVRQDRWEPIDEDAPDSSDAPVTPVSSSEDSGEPAYTKKWTYLADLSVIEDLLRKNGAKTLEIKSAGADGYVMSYDRHYFTAPMSYKQASIDLVTKLGMDYRDARRLLKKADIEREAKCIVKQAQFVGVSVNPMGDQTPESDPYTGIPVYSTPYEDETRGSFTNVEDPRMRANEIGMNVGGEMELNSEGGSDAAIDDEAQQLAQEAAQLGQKNVFDHAAIGGLAKVYDTSAVVDSFLPEFMQTIDRLGRVLFLYYWKHDDFVERYGTDDVIAMEDMLRSVFKSLGKLVLDLRKKAVGQGDSDSVTI